MKKNGTDYSSLVGEYDKVVRLNSYEQAILLNSLSLCIRQIDDSDLDRAVLKVEYHNLFGKLFKIFRKR